MSALVGSGGFSLIDFGSSGIVTDVSDPYTYTSNQTKQSIRFKKSIHKNPVIIGNYFKTKNYALITTAQYGDNK